MADEGESNVTDVDPEEETYHTASEEELQTEEKDLTEEERRERTDEGNDLKAKGNDRFKAGEYEPAIQCYSEALEMYPRDCAHERSVAHGNRAACWVKLNEHEKSIEDCTKSLELDAEYVKVLLRRAQSYEATDKLESALGDYTKVLELDPKSTIAREAVSRLPEQIKEQQEKMKAEMMGKLKELGDVLLKPFGLSTNSFQFQQDPNTGSYSVNMKK